ncbi:hypothetical protein J6590_071880 [Homalodisca vitripennis]|nr:hypothetical protein J6590_071880 [Homalodisca vitripennis]
MINTELPKGCKNLSSCCTTPATVLTFLFVLQLESRICRLVSAVSIRVRCQSTATSPSPQTNEAEKETTGLHKIQTKYTNPFSLFKEWYQDNKVPNKVVSNALTFSTSNRSGKLSSRTLILRRLDEDGFVIMTDGRSRKCKDLEENPYASMVFLWLNMTDGVLLSRQIIYIVSWSDSFWDIIPPPSRRRCSPQRFYDINIPFCENRFHGVVIIVTTRSHETSQLSPYRSKILLRLADYFDVCEFTIYNIATTKLLDLEPILNSRSSRYLVYYIPKCPGVTYHAAVNGEFQLKVKAIPVAIPPRSNYYSRKTSVGSISWELEPILRSTRLIVD